MSDIFICYSKTDIIIASRLEKHFQEQGWSVFIDRKTPVGRQWHREIERELHAAKAVVVLWSESSRDSDYVLEEAGYGKRKNILFPAFITSVEYPYGFGLIQAANLVDWENTADHAGLTELLNSLRQHLGTVHKSTTIEQPKPVQHTEKSIFTSGKTFRDELKAGGEGPLMAIIPAGHFMMGSPPDEPNRLDSEGPQQEVHFAKPFAMGVHTVTFDDYDFFCGNTQREKPGDEDWGRGKKPAINVSWEDARDYCFWLSEQTERSYRLPSESAWEYACRANTKTPYYTGKNISKEQANFARNIEKTTPVGSYPANAFGLYDMHGNVWEWCQDTWHENYNNAPSDGSSWEDGSGVTRVLRGGSWYNYPDYVRSSARGSSHPVYRSRDIGFRVLCSSPID